MVCTVHTTVHTVHCVHSFSTLPNVRISLYCKIVFNIYYWLVAAFYRNIHWWLLFMAIGKTFLFIEKPAQQRTLFAVLLQNYLCFVIWDPDFRIWKQIGEYETSAKVACILLALGRRCEYMQWSYVSRYYTFPTGLY